ncbi:hypothetical protein [Streptomyces akebiae]|uniref:Uncharacterized protein n=1 Tax=Streptomyces akebiae TaxID=2865673 RepID=A0ABX8XYS4_9ACTN|nr:hypothetical protein [Streptomyces akebiae]QYX80316.1 hypothetical protein K1J60_30695 [Streptomyces akebiae]
MAVHRFGELLPPVVAADVFKDGVRVNEVESLGRQVGRQEGIARVSHDRDDAGLCLPGGVRVEIHRHHMRQPDGCAAP